MLINLFQSYNAYLNILINIYHLILILINFKLAGFLFIIRSKSYNDF